MKKRIISASIMLIILVPLVIIGGLPFRILTGIIAILAYREIINLKGFKKYPLPVLILGLVSIILLTLSNLNTAYSIIGLDYKKIIIVYLLMFLPAIYYYGKNKYSIKDAFFLTTFISFIGIVLNLLGNILIFTKAYFIMILIATVMTDTFAYIVGMLVGKTKFTKISPNKSIEGCIGGLVMGTIITSIYYMTFIGASPLYKVIIASLVLSIACELGDLFFSAIKREYEIKDFSNLIPGHGGILDRLDSLSFVVLTFVLVNGLL